MPLFFARCGAIPMSSRFIGSIRILQNQDSDLRCITRGFDLNPSRLAQDVVRRVPGLLGISKEFDKINVDSLTERFDEILSGSPEEQLGATDGFQVGGGAAPGEARSAMAPAQMGKQEALKQFSHDLTEQARKGEIDPIVGRDEEIRQRRSPGKRGSVSDERSATTPA